MAKFLFCKIKLLSSVAKRKLWNIITYFRHNIRHIRCLNMVLFVTGIFAFQHFLGQSKEFLYMLELGWIMHVNLRVSS